MGRFLPLARAALAGLVSLSGVAPGPVPALLVLTYTVNSTADVVDANPGDFKCETAADNGVCTLRAAVMEANAHSAATIDLPTGTYLLTIAPTNPGDASNGRLDIKANVTIHGAGAATTTVDAGVMGDTIFFVWNALTLSGVTLQHGSSSSGGAIFSIGSVVTLTDCVITHCDGGGSSGGIDAPQGGTLALTRCRFDHCTIASGDGGALHLFGIPNASISDCTFDANASSGGGGAIFVENMPLTVRGSTISHNTALTGGGIRAVSSSLPIETLTIIDSTISDNTATSDGGGIATDAPVALYSVTVAHNAADADHNGGGSRGGGIFNASGVNGVTLRDTILADNVGTVYFNGIHLIVDSDCWGDVTSNGYSIVGTPAGCTLGGSYVVGDPMLGPLQDNGGRTATRALLAGSPAIDAGNPSGCDDDLGATLAGDQRGVHRALGGRCDAGAYESGSPNGDVNGDGVVNVADVFYLVNYLFASGPFPPGVANVNGDGSIGVGDVFYLVNYLFAGGPAPI